MHLIEVRAEVPDDRLKIVGPVAKGSDILLHLYACVELLLQDINLVWESARQKLLMSRGKVRAAKRREGRYAREYQRALWPTRQREGVRW